MMFMQANWILVVSYLSKAEISCIFFKNSGTMERSEKKDIPLCLEVLQAEPYRAKEKTVGRAQAWEKIANILSQRAEFKVNKRSVRSLYFFFSFFFFFYLLKIYSQWLTLTYNTYDTTKSHKQKRYTKNNTTQL